MDYVMHRVKVALMLALCAAAVFGKQQEPTEQLDSMARARIEQARSSIVTVTTLDASNKTISRVLGFFIRKDLVVATDDAILDKNSRHQVVTVADNRAIKVLSPGHYFLPYVLVESQADVTPLRFGDSEHVSLNDPVYLLDDSGKIVAGTVTGFTTINGTRTFSISLSINSDNKGAPIFNRNGEVIGIAAKNPNGQNAALVWPSDVLAMMQHLNEPGVGIGAGMGPAFPKEPSSTTVATPQVPTVDTRPVRLSSPRPQYTEAARANNIQGSVTLRVRIDENGNVTAVNVIRGLPDGLNEQAIAVARASKFKPAMKDGKPVAYWVRLEVSFTIR